MNENLLWWVFDRVDDEELNCRLHHYDKFLLASVYTQSNRNIQCDSTRSENIEHIIQCQLTCPLSNVNFDRFRLRPIELVVVLVVIVVVVVEVVIGTVVFLLRFSPFCQPVKPSKS